MNSYDIKCRVIEEELRSIWPEWHVAGHLGGGAFGDVFQIYKENYGVRMDSALKVIQVRDEEATAVFPSDNTDDTEAENGTQRNMPDSLRKEIQIMEALRGAPNIVSIEDFYFKQEGTTSSLFVRMELLTSLKEVLSGRNGQHTLSSIREIRKLGTDICTALMHCEKKGIIHRDIKPANLFVDEFGHYQVGDFGASKRMETVHDAHTMTSIGTVSYMAPEIFRGRAYNNTVDIYALGLVLYQLLNNGRLPFLPTEGSYTARDIDSANYMRLHGTPLPGLEGKVVEGESIDSRLDAVVRKACAVNPGDRYQTAKEFYDALILSETGAKSEVKPEINQLRNQPPQKSPQSEENKERPSAGKKSFIGFVPLLVLAMIVIAVVLGRRGFSSGPDTDITSHTDEKRGGSLSRVTASEDESSEVSEVVDFPEDDLSEVVEVPDPVLKKAIQDALKIGDREMTKADALSLSSLVYSGRDSDNKIMDITGLSEFKNLTELKLVCNQIDDISEIKGLPNLTELDLGNNQISDISALSDLTELQILSLYKNQISDISALSGLTDLKKLYMWENSISDISALSGLANLINLSLSNNQISDISALSGLINLTELYLNYNQISDISALSGLTNLETLYFYGNPVVNKKSREEIMDVLSGANKLKNVGF